MGRLVICRPGFCWQMIFPKFHFCASVFHQRSFCRDSRGRNVEWGWEVSGAIELPLSFNLFLFGILILGNQLFICVNVCSMMIRLQSGASPANAQWMPQGKLWKYFATVCNHFVETGLQSSDSYLRWEMFSNVTNLWMFSLVHLLSLDLTIVAVRCKGQVLPFFRKRVKHFCNLVFFHYYY